jgi:hypothetical protein
MEPVVQVRLLHKHTQSQRIYAFLDSGSRYTLFKYDAATLVGLDPSKNPLFTDEIGGVISGVRDTVYFQKVSLLFAKTLLFGGAARL